jgi:hypothetical protein
MSSIARDRDPGRGRPAHHAGAAPVGRAPCGFAERSRLTVAYLGVSFSFFHQIRAKCAEIFAVARDCGIRPVAVAGAARRTETVYAGGFVQFEQRPRFALGERGRIVDGVFADSRGLFEGMADWERVAILLDPLGRKVKVLLDEGAIAAA